MLSAQASSGLEGGASLAVLPTPIELEVEVCPACGRMETKFKIEFVLSNAFLGAYPCCGEERVVETKFKIEFVLSNAFLGTYPCCGEERVVLFERTVGRAI